MPKTYNKKAPKSWVKAENKSILDKEILSNYGFFDWDLKKQLYSMYQTPSDKSQLLFFFSNLYHFTNDINSELDDKHVIASQEEISTQSEANSEILFKNWTKMINNIRNIRGEKLYNEFLDSYNKHFSEASTHEQDLGKTALFEFEKYAQKIIQKRNVQLISVNVRDWVSLEDPNWKQEIIDFVVETNPENALDLWDNLSTELSSFIDSRYASESAHLSELLSVNVKWQ